MFTLKHHYRSEWHSTWNLMFKDIVLGEIEICARKTTWEHYRTGEPMSQTRRKTDAIDFILIAPWWTKSRFSSGSCMHVSKALYWLSGFGIDPQTIQALKDDAESMGWTKDLWS